MVPIAIVWCGMQLVSPIIVTYLAKDLQTISQLEVNMLTLLLSIAFLLLFTLFIFSVYTYFLSLRLLVKPYARFTFHSQISNLSGLVSLS